MIKFGIKLTPRKTKMATDVETQDSIVGTAVIVATGYSVVQVTLMLRGSVLATKLMSTAPVWIAFDPMLILNVNRTGDRRRD